MKNESPSELFNRYLSDLSTSYDSPEATRITEYVITESGAAASWVIQKLAADESLPFGIYVEKMESFVNRFLSLVSLTDRPWTACIPFFKNILLNTPPHLRAGLFHHDLDTVQKGEWIDRITRSLSDDERLDILMGAFAEYSSTPEIESLSLYLFPTPEYRRRIQIKYETCLTELHIPSRLPSSFFNSSAKDVHPTDASSLSHSSPTRQAKVILSQLSSQISQLLASNQIMKAEEQLGVFFSDLHQPLNTDEQRKMIAALVPILLNVQAHPSANHLADLIAIETAKLAGSVESPPLLSDLITLLIQNKERFTEDKKNNPTVRTLNERVLLIIRKNGTYSHKHYEPIRILAIQLLPFICDTFTAEMELKRLISPRGVLQVAESTAVRIQALQSLAVLHTANGHAFIQSIAAIERRQTVKDTIQTLLIHWNDANPREG